MKPYLINILLSGYAIIQIPDLILKIYDWYTTKQVVKRCSK